MTDSLSICLRHGCRKQALRKFCSDRCRIAHHNAQRAPAEKVRITCLGCGAVFQGRPDQKTCGATCRSRLHRARLKSEASSAVSGSRGAFGWSEATPFRPPSCGKRCKHSGWSPASSIHGCPRCRKRCVPALPNPIQINCVLTLLTRPPRSHYPLIGGSPISRRRTSGRDGAKSTAVAKKR